MHFIIVYTVVMQDRREESTVTTTLKNKSNAPICMCMCVSVYGSTVGATNKQQRQRQRQRQSPALAFRVDYAKSRQTGMCPCMVCGLMLMYVHKQCDVIKYLCTLAVVVLTY